jgi:PhnB protein
MAFPSPASRNSRPRLERDAAGRLTNQAVAAGATIQRPIKNEFYGDRTSGVTDPFGHSWYIHTHIEDVSPAEMDKRAKEAMKKKP